MEKIRPSKEQFIGELREPRTDVSRGVCTPGTGISLATSTAIPDIS